MWRVPIADSETPFALLARTFFAELFASESVASEIQLHRVFVWVFAFLLLPGFFLLVQVFPAYQIAGVVAVAHHRPAQIEAQLNQILLLIVTYSMVTTGIVALFVWDHLNIERRDAMVLGALPLTSLTIVGAKLTALAALLLGGSLVVNLVTAIPFAFTTTLGGWLTLVRHVAACLVANVAAATFVFAALVAIRGAVMLFARERLANILGALLQFGFVVALLCFLIVLLDYGLRPSASAFFVDGAGASVPTAWFVGLFEWLLGVTRPSVDALATRAVLGTSIAGAGAVLVSIAGLRRHMQRALASAGRRGPVPTARMTRLLARTLAGRRPAARATAEFLLLTVARSRPHQALVGVNLAVGVAMIAAVLSSHAHTLASLVHPRTATFWAPLLLAWWAMIGLRAAFFVPAQLPASWVFRSHAPEPERGYWAATRAALAALTLPPIAGLTLVLLVPLVGWPLAAWHLLIVCAATLLLVEVVALTIDFVPFTRAYQAGHARLKTRWWLYVLGPFAFAYVPVRIELHLIGHWVALLEMAAWLLAGAAVLEYVGRCRAHRWTIGEPDDRTDGSSALTVLDLAMPAGMAPTG
ncbi:MAG TPA: hypothetical protein VIC33_13950 [Vicinamibacterales bacterium]|jgi:hypothetical protein